jgi:ABC-type glycerol-3-phosphate transport system substrate-binding protein
MKKVSIFQIVLIASFGAIAVAAVLIFALAVGSNSSSTVGAVTIWGTLDQTAFTTVIRQALDTDTRLAHVTYVQKNSSTYISDLANALASGTGPDLFLLRDDDAYSQAAKLVPIPPTSLSQTLFQNTFVDAANPFLAGSGILGVPLAVDPLVLYWNKDMLSTAGFAEPPQYWDELYNMAVKITVRDTSGAITKSAIDFGAYSNVDNAKDVLSLLILQAGGSITTRDPTTGKIMSAIAPKTGDTIQATPSALRFFTEFSDPSKADYTWNASLPEAQQAFAAGDLALYIGYASEQPLITQMNPNLNFAVAPVPQIRGASAAVDMGHVYAFVVPRTSANPLGAFTVAAILSGKSISQSLSIALGIPSARRDVLALPAQGTDDLFNKQAIITRTWVDPDPAQTDPLFQAMIDDTTSGASLLTAAVLRADQSMSHILGL